MATPPRVLAPALLAALLLAGCLGGTAGAHRLTGAFTEQAGAAELAEADGIARRHGGTMAILESFPPQFVIDGLRRDGCEAARAELGAKAYVARVGECLTPTQGGRY